MCLRYSLSTNEVEEKWINIRTKNENNQSHI